MRRSLEKAVAVAGDPVLDAIFLAGAEPGPGAALVAAPHPLYGGSMDNPVVSEVAYACSDRGLASLRFDWRGVGGSGGAPSGDATDADADYGAALAHLADTVPGAITACGYSFGAAAALRAARHPRVERLVLVAPPPSLCDAAALAAFGGRVLALVGEYDAIAHPRDVIAFFADHPDARVEVIPDADHFFGAGLGAIRRHLLEELGD